MIKKTGVPTESELSRCCPSDERLCRGPCAVLECFEKIPCDPCVNACPRGAITIEGNINNLPVLDYEECNGCGLCVSKCPGIAIFVVNREFSEDEGLVMLPYEFTPLPEPGEMVEAMDRRGLKVCDARVVKVLNRKAQDRTAIISLAAPKEAIMEIRNFRLKR